MKKILLQILVIFSVNLFSQNAKEFTKHINQSIYSFKKVNEEKHKSIRGIEIEFSSNFKIFSYQLISENNRVILTEKEYNYLLKKLRCKSFKKYIKELHENTEYDKNGNLKYRVKYLEPAE